LLVAVLVTFLVPGFAQRLSAGLRDLDVHEHEHEALDG
jgi:hypothetical protein